MNQQDLKPSRIRFTISLLKLFFGLFFEKNPLSMIGLLVAENGICKPLQDFCLSENFLIQQLETIKVKEQGTFSL